MHQLKNILQTQFHNLTPAAIFFLSFFFKFCSFATEIESGTHLQGIANLKLFPLKVMESQAAKMEFGQQDFFLAAVSAAAQVHLTS